MWKNGVAPGSNPQFPLACMLNQGASPRFSITLQALAASSKALPASCGFCQAAEMSCLVDTTSCSPSEYEICGFKGVRIIKSSSSQSR